MSDEDLFLEFKVGEPEPESWEANPWVSPSSKTPGLSSPLAATPQAPVNSRIRRSSSSNSLKLAFDDPAIDKLSVANIEDPFVDNELEDPKCAGPEAKKPASALRPSALPHDLTLDFESDSEDIANMEGSPRRSSRSSQASVPTYHSFDAAVPGFGAGPAGPTGSATSVDRSIDATADADADRAADSAADHAADAAVDATADHAADSRTEPRAGSSSSHAAQEVGEKADSSANSRYEGLDRESPPSTPTQNTIGVHFSGSTTSVGHRRASHSRVSSHGSHIEYHQSPTGGIEKVHIDDESGLPVEGHDEAEDSWEPMPTVGSYEVYDDKNNLLVSTEPELDDTQSSGNAAASGYTRVANNDDAASITSLDDKTDFLFDAHKPTDDVDAEFQMAATKSMLTDQQKIAYAGLCRLALAEIANQVRKYGPKSGVAVESLQIWGSHFILRLYNHLGLSHEEQLMIESLAAHALVAEDLTPCLKQIQKVAGNGEITRELVPDADEYDEIPKEFEVDVEELHEDIPSQHDLNRSLEVDVKWSVMCDLFLNMLTEGEYDSRSRTLLTLVGDKLGVSDNEVAQFERKVTDVLQIDDRSEQDWTEQDIIEARRRKALRKKYAYVGLATVGGGLVIGLSGGLLAPVVGAGLAGALGTIGIAGTSGFLAGVGGTAIITTASTAIGAHVGSRAMLRRVGHVKTFELRPIFNNNRANLIITVSGWMTGKEDDVRLPFSTIDPLVGDVLSVLWEPEMMRSLGQTINIFATEALAFGVQQILAATVFSLLMTSLQAPMWLAKLSYLVDNPWSVSLDRAWAAGYILADTLMKRKLGKRPATLVGYSLGARVIYSCITELARRNAFGLVQDVYIFGTPVFYNKKKFAKARAVVSGRFINGYSRSDWILAFLFPAAKRYGNVLGLDTLPEKDSEDMAVENLDVSELVDGHMNYRAKMPKILALAGWPVLSEEFEEIEDPDPEQLREKQLKLLGELDSAETKPKKSGFFSSWGLDWMQRAKSKGPASADGVGQANAEGETLFDVDAIRQEMESLKPRMVFEQEPMPLPEHDKDDMPVELLEDIEQEPVPPPSALDYDDPASPKPSSATWQPSSIRPSAPPPYSRSQDPHHEEPSDNKGPAPQLQFDDFE